MGSDRRRIGLDTGLMFLHEETIPAKLGHLSFYASKGGFRFNDSAVKDGSIPVFSLERVVGVEGGYPDIISAYNASVAGDRIKVLKGDYVGDLILSKQHISIIGDGIESNLIGNVTFAPGNRVNFTGDVLSVLPFQIITFSGGSENNPVTYTSVATGTAQNSIKLIFDGEDTVQATVDAWNDDPTNINLQVTHNAADPLGIPFPVAIQLAGGTAAAKSFNNGVYNQRASNDPFTDVGGPHVFTANNIGLSGNSISLTISGIDTLEDIVGAWNTVNDDGDGCWFDNMRIDGDIEFQGSTSYNRLTNCWIGSTSKVIDNTVVISTKAPYASFAKETTSYDFYATSTGATYNTFATAEVDVDYAASASGLAKAYAFNTSTISTTAYERVIYDTYATADTFYDAYAFRDVTTSTYAYGDEVYRVQSRETYGFAALSASGIVQAGFFAQGTWTTVNFTADFIGAAGNISLIFDSAVASTANDAGTSVTFTADVAGVAGDSISLVFDDGANETTQVFMVADVAGSLDGTGVIFWDSPTTSVEYYYNVDASGTAPTGGATRSIVIAIAANRTAAQAAGAMATEINADGVLSPGAPIGSDAIEYFLPAQIQVPDTTDNGTGFAVGTSIQGASAISVDDAVATWNGANIGNEVSHDGIGTEIPGLAVSPINLSGGVAAETVDTVVTAWNAGNAGNTVSHDGVGTETPATTVNLTGGSSGDITIAADNTGAVGNSYSIAFNGSDDTNTVLAAYNAANVGDEVSIISGLGTFIVPAYNSPLNLSGGIDSGMTNFIADVPGTPGNAITLVYDGVITIQEGVDNWNAGNAGNRVSLDAGGTAIPVLGNIVLSGGVDDTPIRFIADVAGLAGNNINLPFTGATTDTIKSIVDAWNAGNPEDVSHDGVDNGIIVAPLNLSAGKDFAVFNFIADVIGLGGNSISLPFNGIDDLSTVQTAWNTGGGVGNEVSVNGLGTDILDNQIVNLLAGATNATVTWNAQNLGTGGNSISLTFNGTDTLDQVRDAWNAGPGVGNEVSHSSSNGAGVSPAHTLNLTDGFQDQAGMLLAVSGGTGGNNISLIFDGVSDTMNDVVNDWNSGPGGADPAEYKDITPGALRGIPRAGVYDLSGGINNLTITWNADFIGSVGNVIALAYNGYDTIEEGVQAWNLGNVGNTASHDTNNDHVITGRTIPLDGGGDNIDFDFVAVNAGAGGNTITLTSTGSESMDDLVNAWNAGPGVGNEVLSNSLGRDVPNANTYNLSGGASNVPITFKADTYGTNGNSISLVFDGTDDTKEVIDLWNTLSPTNKVSTPADDSKYIGSGTTINLSGGLLDTPIEYKAANPGTDGNSIILTFDGVSSISTVMTTWNNANPTNKVESVGSQLIGIDDTVGNITLSGGSDNVTILWSATTLGTIGNTIEIFLDGVKTVQDALDEWNAANAGNLVDTNSSFYSFVPPIGINPGDDHFFLVDGGDVEMATFTATVGTGFSLDFNGIDTIEFVVADWNFYNPNATVSYIGRSDGVITPAQVVQLLVNAGNNLYILIQE